MGSRRARPSAMAKRNTMLTCCRSRLATSSAPRASATRSAARISGGSISSIRRLPSAGKTSRSSRGQYPVRMGRHPARLHRVVPAPGDRLEPPLVRHDRLSGWRLRVLAVGQPPPTFVALRPRVGETDQRVGSDGKRLLSALVPIRPLPQLGAARLDQQRQATAVGLAVGLRAGLRAPAGDIGKRHPPAQRVVTR